METCRRGGGAGESGREKGSELRKKGRGGWEGWREGARERERDAQALTHLLYRLEPIATPRLEEIG